jgi:hypothetical protein
MPVDIYIMVAQLYSGIWKFLRTRHLPLQFWSVSRECTAMLEGQDFLRDNHNLVTHRIFHNPIIEANSWFSFFWQYKYPSEFHYQSNNT